MGGIGKTTLAKHVYNQILDEFECCSFLKDIRETSLQHKGIEGLQAQLYTNLSKVAHGHNFTSIDEGTSELKYRFREKKVLILLDDVDQIHQLNVLAAEVGWFGAGSRIIITTRISDILDVHPVSDVYEVKEMDQEDALRLFCRHAFRKDRPNDEFKSVVYDVVKTTGGLPLALEVIGSFLSLKRKPIWEETLWKLKRAPKEEVQKRLQISYDMLGDDQKQMFLDVACLFIGEDIDVVMHVWKDRKFSAETGTDVLLACSLIKIGEDNRIWMHDQLRDLGREIVRKENYKQPGMRSRLWHVDEARDALEKQVIYIDNEALHLSFDSTRDNHIKNEQLRNFPNIWYLCLYDADLIGDFQHLLANLRWFTWQYSSSKCCAININLEKLLVLDLSYSSKIQDDWEIWSSIQNAKKLRVLNLTSCMKVSTLDVSMLINLEKLILDNCVSLKEISIGKLEDLLTLSMKNCRSVSTLDVSMLINLEELILDYCVRLKEISIGKLEDLLTLSMKNCSSVSTLDVSMLINLEKLILDYCYGLKQISIGKLENLLILSMDCCISVSTLDVSMLINLEKLILDDCYDLEEISIGKLEDLLTLSMKNCKSVSTLDVSMLMNLEKLIIDDYYDLKEISIGKLEGLLTLSMENCNSITELPIWSLPSLERLLLPNCQSIERLPDSMGKLKSLIELDLSGTFFPTLPNSICDLENLQILKITDSKISNLPNVILESERLHIIDNFLGWQYYLKGNKVQQVVDVNTYIKMSRSLKGSKVLHELKFSGAGNHEHWTTCEILSRPDTLQLLHVLLCGSIEKLLIPSNLKFLLRLDFHDCEKLHQIEGLDELEALQELRVQSCGAIKKLPNLCKLKSLRILDCFDCEELEEIEGLDGLKSLEEFNLRKCRAIQKLPRLSDLQSLKILNFHGCEKLQELEGLDGLKSLEKFNLEKCRAIEKLASLSKLRSLKELNCHGCEKLQEIEGLDGLESLEEFNLEKCRAIEKLASLSKLKSLKILIFHGCEKLQEIEGLDGLEKLAHVNISGCKGLRHIPVLPRHFNWIHMKGCNSYEETHRSMEPKMLCCICQESGFFFNMKYFEEEVHEGNWDDVERCLSGFTKVDDNRYSMKIFFEIRKQKYLEALDKRDRAKAVEILVKDLKVFVTFNEELFKEITQLLTLENFREKEQSCL